MQGDEVAAEGLARYEEARDRGEGEESIGCANGTEGGVGGYGGGEVAASKDSVLGNLVSDNRALITGQ